MSDTTEPVAEQPEESSIFDQNTGVDWALAYLVNLAEAGVEMSLSVTVEGVLVSGTLISGRKYFQQMAEALTGASGSDDFATVIGSGFESFKKIYPEQPGAELLKERKPHFLHLKDAMPVLDATPLGSGGTLWRVQLSKVGSFSPSATRFRSS